MDKILSEKATRQKRFVRPDKPARGQWVLLPEYEPILEFVHANRALTSAHLQALTGYSADWTRRILNQLWKHAYLDRIERSVAAPCAYALGLEGAKYLKQKGIYHGRLDFTTRNKYLKNLDHLLLTADFMVGLHGECVNSRQARVIYFPEMLDSAPPRTRALAKPFHWPVEVTYEGKSTTVTIEPDKIFGIHFLNLPEGKNKAYFFLESDMATEPVMPKDFRKRSNIFKKLLAYRETDKQKIHTELYGIKNFRALFIIRSRRQIQPDPQARVQNIINAAQCLYHDRKIFLLTTDQELANNSVLTLGWRNHKDETPIQLLMP